MGKKTFLKDNKDLILIFVIYTIITIILFKIIYLHAGADGISYMSIAKYYAAGNWENAINGYWSPLYSWLMAPFFLLNLDPYQSIYITRVVSFIAGFLIIISVKKLMNIFESDRLTKFATLLSLLPLIIFTTIIYDTPDLTMVALFICYLSIILNPNYSKKSINGVLCGVIGVFLYFCKSYMFPFFLLHFIIFNLYYYFEKINQKKKHVIFKNLVFGLIVFLTFSGVWVGLISEKYDEFTIGTAGEYNHALLGHETNLHPIHFLGLIKPPNENSVSIWEDPTLIKLKDWSAFSSWEHFTYEIRVIGNNILETFFIIEYYSLFSILIIFLGVYLIFRPETIKKVKKNLLLLILTILIYIGGYLYIFTGWRYLLPLAFLLIVTGFYSIDVISNIYQLKKLKYLIIIILMLSFTINPIYDIIHGADFNGNTFDLIKTLKEDYHIHGNVASKGPKDIAWEKIGNGFDPYMTTMIICYYLNCKYYGVPKKTDNYKEMENELNDNNITYFFVWNSNENFNFSNYKEITNNNTNGLKIYEKKHNF